MVNAVLPSVFDWQKIVTPFSFFPSQTGGEFKQMAVTTVRLVSHLPVSHF